MQRCVSRLCRALDCVCNALTRSPLRWRAGLVLDRKSVALSGYERAISWWVPGGMVGSGEFSVSET